MNIIQGNLIAQGLKIGIVASRFNEFIVSKLIGGAEDGLQRHGVRPEDIDLAWTPGALSCRWRHREWRRAKSTTR